MNNHELSLEIKKKILETGASDCGFAKAGKLEKEFDFLEKWLEKGYHAGKTYLERNTEIRANPELFFDGAQTVISVLYNYYVAENLSETQWYKISRYAYGKDYHLVLNEKLNIIAEHIRLITESKNTRAYVDSAPIFEKAWAQRAGLGWIGKNSLLTNKNSGSFNFIGTIVTDVELQYDIPVEEKCGDCKICLEACPTNAIVNPHELDVRKCISHLTMEQKNALPVELKNKFDKYIYGCDICQNCCPWNKNLQDCSEQSFFPSELLKNMKKSDWDVLNEEKFSEIFNDSAVKRITFQVLKRNIDFINGKD